jgi:DNA-binding MarR family transcriptional regulator
MLLYYSRRGELPLGKISDRLQVHRASVTNAVDKLCEGGYVERVPHETDRRAVLARITAEGRRAAEAATTALNAADMAMAPLGADACERVYEILRPLRADVDGFDPA